jgi:hypothetical protein
MSAKQKRPPPPAESSESEEEEEMEEDEAEEAEEEEEEEEEERDDIEEDKIMASKHFLDAHKRFVTALVTFMEASCDAPSFKEWKRDILLAVDGATISRHFLDLYYPYVKP